MLCNDSDIETSYESSEAILIAWIIFN